MLWVTVLHILWFILVLLKFLFDSNSSIFPKKMNGIFHKLEKKLILNNTHTPFTLDVH